MRYFPGVLSVAEVPADGTEPCFQPFPIGDGKRIAEDRPDIFLEVGDAGRTGEDG